MDTVASAPDLAGLVARFAAIGEDTEAFQDVQDPSNRRVVKYLVARHSRFAAIRDRDNLTVAMLESMPGKGPKLHAHDYPEIFFCQEGTYGIIWGDHGEHCVTLGPLDTFAVPPGINRQVVNTGSGPGRCLVLFDTTRVDPNEGITMPAHVIAAEQASGKAYRRRALDGIPMTPQQVASYVGLHADLPDDERDGEHVLRRVIDSSGPHAAITAPHNLTMALAESRPGAVSATATTRGRELLTCLAGRIEVESGSSRIVLDRYDSLPLAAGVVRTYRNIGAGDGVLLIVGTP
ncbi:MAG: cupin domain-containing protein [Alphaproteobacteria bacterium]